LSASCGEVADAPLALVDGVPDVDRELHERGRHLGSRPMGTRPTLSQCACAPATIAAIEETRMSRFLM
jgi:hypothetical protein